MADDKYPPAPVTYTDQSGQHFSRSVKPLRRVTVTLGDGTSSFEINVHDLDDNALNRLKSLAESGRLKLEGVTYEHATKTDRKEWMR